MAKGKILFKEMIRQMYSGIEFNIKVVSYSETTGKGGAILEYKKAKLLILTNSDKVLPPAIPLSTISTGNSKKPSHNLHNTINIVLPSTDIKKIRRTLIIEFNNQNVFI